MDKGERFVIKSGENDMVGYITKPEGEGKFPTVIVSHGFSSNTNRTHPYAQIFARAGYATVIFDFTKTGTGESSGDSTLVSALTEIEDLRVMLDYVKTLDFVDADNITLAGCSMGGFVTALLAPEVESEVKKLVLFFPAFCIPDHTREGHVQTTHFDPENIPDIIETPRMRLGRKFAEDVINMDAFECCKHFSKPVLIVHGIEDYVVTVDYSEKAAVLYKDCTLKEIHGDHGFNTEESFAECKKLTLEWLTR